MWQVTAVAIGFTLWVTNKSLPALAVLSTSVAGAACLACLRMHRLYSESMWHQIERSEPRVILATLLLLHTQLY